MVVHPASHTRARVVVSQRIIRVKCLRVHSITAPAIAPRDAARDLAPAPASRASRRDVSRAPHLNHGQIRDGFKPRHAARDHFRHRNGPTTIDGAAIDGDGGDDDDGRTCARAAAAAAAVFRARVSSASVRAIASGDGE